jgi:hypothetical protein
MSQHSDSTPDAKSAEKLSRLADFLPTIAEPHDLVTLLQQPFYVNPSDLFAIIECETRLRGYSYDRTVSLCIFMADLYHDITFRVDSDDFNEDLQGRFEKILWSVIEHYQRPELNEGVLRGSISKLGDIGCTALIHESFERKFREWRQMIRAARRMPVARDVEHSPEYGPLHRGVTLADRIGNMLSHLRHIYCDQAFEGNLFVFD